MSSTTNRITALRAQRRTTDRVNLYIDGEFCCGVAYEVVVAEGLRTGDAITPEVVQRLAQADGRWKAKQAALSLLGTRARATGELSDRLRRKGFDEDATAYAIAEVRRMGLLDDRAFAESWVRDRLLLRPRGARALVGELSRKRVAPDVARDAVACVMHAADVCDADLCAHAASKWLRTHPTPDAADREAREKQRRRLAGYLGRRGFSGHAVRSALQEL